MNCEFVEEQHPHDLAFRPIIRNCIASKLNFTDILLKLYVAIVSSYIRDDIEFLSNITRIVKNTELLLSFDFTDMYTNIDNEMSKAEKCFKPISLFVYIVKLLIKSRKRQ